MVRGITLSSSMRSNLFSLKTISTQMSKTQDILSTGKKVNKAIDNANSYYQSRSLSNRASDLNSLLDFMSQGVQTIQAASEGLVMATSLLEQASVIASEAISEPLENREIRLSTTDIETYKAAGYEVMTADNASEMLTKIQAGNVKVVLGEDISLSQEIIFGHNVLFEGNGHSLDITSANGYGFYINSKKGISIANLELNFQSDLYYRSEGMRIAASEVDISAIKINNTDESGILDQGGYGVMGYARSKINIDSIAGINADVILGEGDMPNIEGIFKGEENTQAIIDEIGAEGLAATATDMFYVGDKKGEFGQGTWYLPSIGEWMELYGTDIETATKNSLYGTAGVPADKANFNAVQDALTTLASKKDSEGNSVAQALRTTYSNGDRCYYWSSSEYSSGTSWIFSPADGFRGNTTKVYYTYVRAFQIVENCFNPGDNKPEVGYVVYDDKTWSSADNYDNSKTAAGVIYDVDESNGAVKIINLKDLTFSSNTAINNFNPDNPYGGAYGSTRWSTGENMYENIDEIHDYYGYINPNDNITVTGEVSAKAFDKTAGEAIKADSQTVQKLSENYKSIINQYNNLIEDSSYHGINLLSGGKMDVMLNESRTHKYSIVGKDMSSQSVGVVSTKWQYTRDINNSINEIDNAVNTIRSFQEELGNNLGIIQTRQSFTEALSDVLEVGADKLTLADMNEVSAEYLMLQIRQQLAVNSLSLASQSAKSILRLF